MLQISEDRCRPITPVGGSYQEEQVSAVLRGVYQEKQVGQ